MQVGNASFMLTVWETLHPTSIPRELTQNALEGIQCLPIEMARFCGMWTGTQTLLRVSSSSASSTGVGMTGEEMMQYINALSSSVNVLSNTGNYGVGENCRQPPE